MSMKTNTIKATIFLFSFLLSAMALKPYLPLAQETEQKPDLSKFVSRLQMDYLETLNSDIVKLQKEALPVKLKSGVQDIRACLHFHSFHSHDSKGTQEEIIAGAKKNSIKAIFMSEHPSDKEDVIANGFYGVKDGVMFFPGIESNQFLVFPKTKKVPDRSVSQQELINAVHKDGGMIFIAHPEEQEDWSLQNLTGMEIYNSHADIKEEVGGKDIAKAFTGKTLRALFKAFPAYPQLAFAAIFDAPADNLKRWDELGKTQKIVGIAANDSHQNVKILTLQVDPYPVSMHHVNTHILTKKFDEKNVLENLKAGHVYVSFDWIADPTGFVFMAKQGKKNFMMGDELKFLKGIKLTGAVPLKNASLRIIKDNVMVHEQTGNTVEYEVKENGVYRLEAHVTLAGHVFPWIYSNPVYVR